MIAANSQNPTPSPPPERPLLVRINEVCRFTSLSRRTVWRLVSSGQFPQPCYPPGVRAALWRMADLDDWCETLRREG